jgi:iron(III) transport system substrate-binding protein
MQMNSMSDKVRKKMRSHRYSGALALLVVALTGATVRASETEASVYAAAKKEGKVVYWTSYDTETMDAMGARFAKRFPGIAIEPFRINPGPAIERIITQSRAGQLNVDAVNGFVSYMPQLVDRGLAISFPYDEVLGVPKGRLVYDNKGLVEIHLDSPIVYNTTWVKPGEIKSWDDLLDPKWSGKIIMDARGVSFAILAGKWGEEKTADFLRRLLANKPIIMKSGTQVIEALAGGQGAIGIGTYAGRAIQYKEKGAPIEWARVSPVPTGIILIMAGLKGSAHPNAAHLWASFWATPEGQEAIWEGHRYGMVAGDNLSPHGRDIQASHLEVVFENTDPVENSRLLQKMGGIIGSLQ